MFRGSTLAASEWPAEKREGCTQAVDPLRVDKTEREGGREGRNESGRRFNAPPFRNGESMASSS